MRSKTSWPDDASLITGAVLPVDGGFLAQ